MSYMKILFLIFLIYSSIFSWMSNNWLFIWILMELNTVFFVGFTTMFCKSFENSEFMMKYFIIQCFFSLLLMIFIIIYVFNMVDNLIYGVLGFMLLKLGLFPFHFWLISILGKLDWSSFLVLSSLLKLTPIIMVYYLVDETTVSFVLLGSLMVGSLGGINNSCIQKLFGYSSMIHVSWLIYSLAISIGLFLFYFLGYLFMMILLSFFFFLYSSYFIVQLKFKVSSFMTLLMVFFYGLSLCGFPPFLGFLMKWLVIESFWVLDLKMLVFIMVGFSLFSCFFYLQLWFYILLMYAATIKWGSSGLLKISMISFFFLMSYSFLFLLF